ncbi:two-component system response regulator YesN [Paenibacillus phyllosphaerae]|uniref:Two-component system response regulator YesN n=1 Tax=Paenibacillus phyllosphaerae TaxID=274593 RepID=A0A7W5AZ89_9BACL|nr:response regulator [Paenibacillus phyllosphaerae]MBB3111510.1 two-component system response regulator YesN [Paenibacillus phyllosphaerae]
MTETTLKLVVIDDIRSVVDMITKKIPWQNYGIEIAGSATNGEEGLALVEALKPELVLTDVRMPKMDGLEMTRRIAELAPGCKVVILSAYTDFEYAQKALQYGAVDYVKKPFAIGDLVNVIQKARELWLGEQSERDKLRTMEQAVKESLPALRQQYLSLLINHPTDIQDTRQWWGFLELAPLGPPFAVMVIQIDQLTDRYGSQGVRELELARFALQNIVEETLQAHAKAIVFREAFNRYVCLVEIGSLTIPLLDLADHCCANIASYTKFTISVGIGEETPEWRGLPRSYQQALSALSYHFYTGGNGAFRYSPPDNQGEMWMYSAESEQEFLFAFRSGNLAKCTAWLQAVFAEMGAAHTLPAPSDVEHLFRGLALRMFRIMLEKFSRPALEAFERRMDASRLAGSMELTDYRSWLIALCEAGCGLMERERSSESQRIIYRSMDYIKSNLHLDLTLELCARAVNLSWGYYSNLFKKVTGTTFQQYVTQLRIERAKELLLADYQVQEIAQQLGYEHRRYFSEVFKKQTGLTPTEFKESFLGKP